MTATITEIPMALEDPSEYGDPKYRGMKTDHVLVTPNGTRKGVGAVPAGSHGRKVMHGELIPGPWAYTYGLATVLDNHGGTGAEMRRLAAEDKVHHVEDGTRLHIDGVLYRVEVVRHDYITLHEVEIEVDEEPTE